MNQWIKNLFFKWSIQAKLVLIISIIIIISITGIIYIATYYFKKDNEIRIKENTLEVAQLIASTMKADITVIIKEAEFLAGQHLQGFLQFIPKKPIKETIEGLYEGEEILGIYLYSKEGDKTQLVSSIYNDTFLKMNKLSSKSLDDLVFKNLSKHRDTIRKNETVIQELVWNNIHLISISHPFPTPVTSFLVAVTKVENLLSSLKNSGITDNFIINEEGKILIHSRGDQIPKNYSIQNTQLYEKIRQTPINNGQIKYFKEGEGYYIASFRKIGLGDLTVVTEVSEKKAMEEVENIQRRNFYLMVIILNLSIFVVLVFSKKLTKPILKLVEASKRIEKGDFHINLRHDSGDEVGILTESFTNMAKGLAERDKIKDAFGKFVNTELAEQVLHSDIRLGGSRKECAIFFSDIRDFTATSEDMEPEDVVEFLNEYMTIMVACVNEYGGIVDKFIGDSIMAVWGALNPSPEDTYNAISCALAMRNALIEFNNKKRKKNFPFVRIGIGINTGIVLSGQIGSEERLEFTVVGDAVNLASRIESLNKEFQTDILVSESSYEKTKDLFHFVKMKTIQVRGKKKPQTIYAVLGKKGDPNTPKNLNELRKIIHPKLNPSKKSIGNKILSRLKK